MTDPAAAAARGAHAGAAAEVAAAGRRDGLRARQSCNEVAATGQAQRRLGEAVATMWRRIGLTRRRSGHLATRDRPCP